MPDKWWQKENDYLITTHYMLSVSYCHLCECTLDCLYNAVRPIGPPQTHLGLMVPTPTQWWLKSSWKMWERPLICKPELRLTEVEPPHSHTPHSTFVEVHSICTNSLHDTFKTVSPTTWARQAGGRRGPADGSGLPINVCVKMSVC